VASILAAELLKVRTRWMPYILLLFMVAVLALQTFGPYAGWRLEDDPEFDRAQALRTFALPWSLAALLDMTQYLGAILLAVLAASAVGTEHGWGTVRQALIRGQTRRQFLTIKLLGIITVGGIGFLLAFAFGLLFSAIVTRLADRPITLDVPGGPSVPDVALMALRASYGIVPYALLAFCLAVVGRSTTLGVAGTLTYLVILEPIVLAILEGIGGGAADARAFFVGHNVNALLVANRIGEYETLAWWRSAKTALPSELPDPAIAALVLGGYCLAFLALAFWVFRRRDIHA
jgi:ABC-type transport system involved in multi-copper enzyme maturation permease subunit